jgi:dUTP pyrophosphatase
MLFLLPINSRKYVSKFPLFPLENVFPSRWSALYSHNQMKNDFSISWVVRVFEWMEATGRHYYGPWYELSPAHCEDIQKHLGWVKSIITYIPPAAPLVGVELNPGPSLLVKRLTGNAILPKKGSYGAAGYDISSNCDIVVYPRGGRALVTTGLAIFIPSGTYGRIAPRSGLALKAGINVGAGVIDSDYRGEVGVILFNHSDTEFAIKSGDRIAQLILERIEDRADVVEVGDLADTNRGANGFGSTGVSATVPTPPLVGVELNPGPTRSGKEYLKCKIPVAPKNPPQIWPLVMEDYNIIESEFWWSWYPWGWRLYDGSFIPHSYAYEKLDRIPPIIHDLHSNLTRYHYQDLHDTR